MLYSCLLSPVSVMIHPVPCSWLEKPFKEKLLIWIHLHVTSPIESLLLFTAICYPPSTSPPPLRLHAWVLFAKWWDPVVSPQSPLRGSRLAGAGGYSIPRCGLPHKVRCAGHREVSVEGGVILKVNAVAGRVCGCRPLSLLVQ